MKEHVLLTGITGFIASHIAIQLLEKGYTVTGTMRNLERAEKLKDTLSKHTKNIDNLYFVEAELQQVDAWKDIVKGKSKVIHTASPVPKVQPNNEDEVIVPAREGTRNVLSAAIEEGIEKVVLTSSVAAIGYGHDEKKHLTEAFWTDPENRKATTPYVRSKTYAEKLAWEMVEGTKTKLTTVNPSVVFGPSLEHDYGSSLAILKQFLSGKMPRIPDLSISVVDVRDVAQLHILAMESDRSDGDRFIAATSTVHLKEIAEILREEFPAFDRKIPKKDAPNFLMKIMALFDKRIKSISSELGEARYFDSSKAQELLAWKPRSAKESIISGAKALIENGNVKT